MHYGGTIGDIGEKELIRSIIKPLLNPNDDPNSVGDDCAAIDAGAAGLVCVSTDRVPADLISFRLGIIDHRGLGYYLAVLNLSDLAAAGARPAGLLLNFGLPSATRVEDFVALFEGAKSACEKHGCTIIGGDLSNSSELSLSATSVGIVAAGRRMITRRGTKVGDLVFCEEPVGLTSTAFAYFLRAKPTGLQLAPSEEELLMDQFRKPCPRFDVGYPLLELGRVTAMDNTDGVAQSLAELAELNGVGICIDGGSLPIHDLSYKVARFLEVEPYEVALGPGADFQLIGTLEREAHRQMLPQDVRIIGESVNGVGLSIRRGSKIDKIDIPGWNYFVPPVGSPR